MPVNFGRSILIAEMLNASPFPICVLLLRFQVNFFRASFAFAFLSFLFLPGFVLAQSGGAEAAQIGASCPLIKLPSINDSASQPSASLKTVADFPAKLVMVNFWASWCTPCVKEMPALQRLYQVLKPEGFLLLSINVDNPGQLQRVRQFLKDSGYDFPVLSDADLQLADKLGVTGFPETFFLSGEGKFLGFVDPGSAADVPLVRVIADRPWDAPAYLRAVRRMIPGDR